MSRKVHGYAGKLLRVDSTKGNIADVLFDEEILQQYLDGTGLGVRILYDEVNPQITWSDPVNRLIITSGPLGGTRIGGSGTISIITT